MMVKYDLAILGGGPGGYVAAIRAAQLGMKTAIIEKDKLGGICLNWGCIPTKALLKNAEVVHYIKNAEKYGINISDYSLDFSKSVDRSRDVADRLSKGISFLMKKNKINHVIGEGYLSSKTTIEIKNDKGKETIHAEKIIIATGGSPRILPGIKLDGKCIISYKKAMVLKSIPSKLIIIGSGAIGVEFAYFYNAYGTEVHLIEMLPNVLPIEDEEISKELARNFKKLGIKIYPNTTVQQIKLKNDKPQVKMERQGKVETLEGDIALVSVGITGNIRNIGLEEIGISTENGFICINEYNQSSIPSIYAIGDVTGPPWLAHVASAQGQVAVEHAAGNEIKPIDYSNIPNCTYCQPQVASLGLTEVSAREKGFQVKIGRFDFRASGKAVATGDTAGFVKLVFDRELGELLGAHIVGSEATEMIAELGVAKLFEATWDELAGTIHAHPTLSEAIMEAALDAKGLSMHK